MIVFWDTNILIDILSDARENHLEAIKLLSTCLYQKHAIALTSLSLANACYILRKHHDVYDFENRYLKLNSLIEIAVMDSYQASNSLQSGWSDFEDSLQYQSAQAHGCDLIITRDRKGFTQSNITTMTPEEFIDEYSHPA
jgi:predicted nucleic acid-binding protein